MLLSVLKYYKPDSTTNNHEIGPGARSGRLLKAIIKEGLAFKNYCGYRKPQIKETVRRSGFHLVDFDTLHRLPDFQDF